MVFAYGICRGADSRARLHTFDPYSLPLKWYAPIASVAASPLRGVTAMQVGNIGGMSSMAQCSQICHCEAPKGPWQSREGTAIAYRLPTKTYQPIASVAALTERLAGWQYSGHVLYGVRPPSLSFRGAKRRGNLAVPGPRTGKSSANTVTLRGGASRTPPPTRRVRSAELLQNFEVYPKSRTF